MIAFSGDGRTLATIKRDSGTFHIWDIATGKHVVTGERQPEPAGHTSSPYGTAFSPDGRRLASGGGLDGTIHVWDLASSKSLLSIHRPSRWVRRVAWSRDGRWLYSTWTDDQLWISEAATAERKYVIKLEDPDRLDTRQDAISMYLSADSRTLVAFSYYYPKAGGGPKYDETLITGWDPITRQQLFLRRLPGTESSTAVSPDARLLAASSPSSKFEMAAGLGPMRLEDLATGQPLLTFPGVEGQTWPLAFSPDSRLLAAYNSKLQAPQERRPDQHGLQPCLVGGSDGERGAGAAIRWRIPRRLFS